MITHVTLKNLTARQRQAHILPFRKGWRLRRIAVELGKEKTRVIRKQPRVTRGLSLTDWERVV